MNLLIRIYVRRILELVSCGICKWLCNSAFRFCSSTNGYATLHFDFVHQQNGYATLHFGFVHQQNGYATLHFGFVHRQNGYATLHFDFVHRQNGYATLQCALQILRVTVINCNRYFSLNPA